MLLRQQEDRVKTSKLGIFVLTLKEWIESGKMTAQEAQEAFEQYHRDLTILRRKHLYLSNV